MFASVDARILLHGTGFAPRSDRSFGSDARSLLRECFAVAA